jgi:hypothetical protein
MNLKIRLEGLLIKFPIQFAIPFTAQYSSDWQLSVWSLSCYCAAGCGKSRGFKLNASTSAVGVTVIYSHQGIVLEGRIA